ncbi:MAG: hypothetical protein KME22_15540 [Hassallia sp. WJT32-NPBG1]|nr:hypothetical protein [Hassallia sp. WJT32-NPBG1]
MSISRLIAFAANGHRFARPRPNCSAVIHLVALLNQNMNQAIAAIRRLLHILSGTVRSRVHRFG